jgi:dihydrofolate synthase / folylpolyglutamate synthase
MKFGLENISRLTAALDHPERAFQSIVVAGTNGKGSVTAMVHRALIAAGHRAARYTSPHLERLEERYVIGDREVDSVELESAAALVRDAIDRLQRGGELESPPTFFETVTAVAFVLFRGAGVAAAVLEVGLGGRLDATNVVTPIAVAITSIDFDHETLLGHTLESIAFEKAGVIRPGIPVVCGPLPPEAESVIRHVSAEQSARFITTRDDTSGDPWLAGPALKLRGTHQRDNARVAIRLLRELDGLGLRLDDDAIRTGLTEVDWPGRLELLRDRKAEVLLDAAHNPGGARALAAYLRQIGWTGCALVFGAMQEKNVQAMLAELATVCGAVVCTTPASPRALDADTVADMARAVPGASWTVSAVVQPAAALARATDAYQRVVVAGSIFLIGPLRGILRAR